MAIIRAKARVELGPTNQMVDLKWREEMIRMHMHFK
jgi:hypothetical protein